MKTRSQVLALAQVLIVIAGSSRALGADSLITALPLGQDWVQETRTNASDVYRSKDGRNSVEYVKTGSDHAIDTIRFVSRSGTNSDLLEEVRVRKLTEKGTKLQSETQCDHGLCQTITADGCRALIQNSGYRSTEEFLRAAQGCQDLSDKFAKALAPYADQLKSEQKKNLDGLDNSPAYNGLKKPLTLSSQLSTAFTIQKHYAPAEALLKNADPQMGMKGLGLQVKYLTTCLKYEDAKAFPQQRGGGVSKVSPEDGPASAPAGNGN